MDLDSGGHLTHGAKASVSGQYFNAIGYGVGEDGLIDYEQIRDLARTHNPKLIIAGASAYPRRIDFAEFRRIADEVGAYLLADVSHIAGLIAAGMHDSPIDHAHFTTTSTYKQLYGPRGGLILMGRDFDAVGPDGKVPLHRFVQRAVFPYFQGTPNLAAIAAKARALDIVSSPSFGELASRIVSSAQDLADQLLERDYQVLTGGTDNHMVLVDILTSRSMTGMVAEKALEDCNLIVNKNRIVGDTKSAIITSGIRFGTNGIALRHLDSAAIGECAELLDFVLGNVEVLADDDFRLENAVIEEVRSTVKGICRRFPLPQYGFGGQ